jgi:tRNA(Ile)-lysidine synthase
MSSTESNNATRTVEHFILKKNIKPGSSILIGLSGGPDSVALLSMLAELRGKYRFRLGCCHIDHGIRPISSSRKEAELVRSLASCFDIPLSIRKIEKDSLKKRARAEGRSLEETARAERYALFNEVMKREGYEYLALGHHRDDQEETAIMRFFQGSGPNGLAGIPEMRGSIIRPLLSLTRDEILVYVDAKKLQYRIDESNYEEDFLRNRVRNRLIPCIKETIPDYRAGIASVSGKMERIGEFISQESKKRIPWRREGNRFIVSKKRFAEQPGVLRIESIYTVINQLGRVYSEKRVPYKFLAPLYSDDAVCKEGVILQGFGIVLKSEGNSIFFEPEVVHREKKSYFIRIDGEGRYHFGADFYFQVEEKIVSFYTENSISIPKKEIRFPLIAKSRKPGDILSGERQQREIKKLFSQWQVPSSLRWKIPVLEDRSGIIAVVGKPFGFKNRVADSWKRCHINRKEKMLVFNVRSFGVGE